MACTFSPASRLVRSHLICVIAAFQLDGLANDVFHASSRNGDIDALACAHSLRVDITKEARALSLTA
jgi:hypothetical protein